MTNIPQGFVAGGEYWVEVDEDPTLVRESKPYQRAAAVASTATAGAARISGLTDQV